MDPRVDKSDSACPLCNTAIDDPVKFSKLRKKFDSERALEIREFARKKDLEHRTMIAALKAKHREEIQKLRQDHRDSERALRERMLAIAKKDKEVHKGAIEDLRKLHQVEIDDLRNSFEKQTLKLQKEQEAAFNAQLKEIIHNYGSLATAHNKEVERLKKEKDETDLMFRKKEAEISKLRVDLARSSSRLEVRELAVRLQERDATIAELSARIRELERAPNPPPAEQGGSKQHAKTLTEDEQKEKLKEYMRAIIEITRSQQASKRAADSSSSEGIEKESRADKVLGWFL